MALLSVIRRWHFRDELSIREIARRTGLSRSTIRKYLRLDGVEPKFKVPDRPSKLDPFADRLAAWLRTESKKPRKQKRTIKQLHVDLISLGYDGSYNRVAAFAREWREDLHRQMQTSGRGTFVPLSFEPGEAFQFDWSEDWAIIGNERTKLQVAWRDVAWGIYDVVLAFGVDKAVMPKGTVLEAGTVQFEAQLGDIFPGTFALIANRHMTTFGTTPEQMAQVSVKNHANGALTPKAQFNKPVTLDEVLASPMIAEPLTLFSCCPNSDGAAAAIVCSHEWMKARAAEGIEIAASVLASGDYEPRRDLTYWESERHCARSAFAVAGISPRDVDLVEVHDAFTISEIVHCETLGFCAPGEGGVFTCSGETALTGSIPINPSGGLLARGHPPGASGLAQIYEIVQQLRGTAGKRQIVSAEIGLAQIMGGNKGNDAQACAIHILRKTPT